MAIASYRLRNEARRKGLPGPLFRGIVPVSYPIEQPNDRRHKGNSSMQKDRCHVTAMLVALPGLMLIASAEAAQWKAWRNALAPKGTATQELVLAEDGKTDYAIVVPASASSQEAKAAEDLALWLKEMTGATFPIVEDTTPARAHEISIGRTNRAKQAGVIDGSGDLAEEGYAVAVRGPKLFLLGGRTRGPINAVYALLEEDLGCRWYSLEGTRLPRSATLRCRPVPRRYVPPFRIRDPFYKVAFNATWSLCNRTNAPSAAVPEKWGGRMDYALFVHTVHALVPPGKYFKDHPEYFMLDKSGKRNAHQLCMTNPDVIRIATQSVLDTLKAKPHCEIISVSKTDGGRTCQCKRCKELDTSEGSECASLLYMVNRVAEAVEKHHPGLVISTLAYLETVRPPKTIRPRKNVAIRLCTDRCMWAHPFTPAEQSKVFSEAITSWSKIHDRIHIWDYVVNFSHYTAPMPNMDVIAKNIRYFARNNCTAVMTQGAYQSPGAERDWLRSWVIAKLLWDPSRDERELVQDFIWGYYGEAAPALAEYDALLRKAGADHAETMKAPKGGIRFGMDDPFLSEAFLDKATTIFDRAADLARTDPDVALRVERARMPIMYVKLYRGPAFVGKGYSALIDRFEKVARRVGLTHIYEGPPDLEKKLKAWREAAAKR
jgi:hypothetical protein